MEQKKQDVETKRQSLKEAQAHLTLVMSGPYPQEIDAARKEVEAAKATLKRLQQQLKFYQDQINRTPLVMPFDGRLATSFLDQRVGSYFKQGDLFAIAQDDSHIRAEVRTPEYNVGLFSIGNKAEMKLLAYPNQPVIGKVVAVEPIATTDSIIATNDTTGLRTSYSAPVSTSESTSTSNSAVVRVIVDIPNKDKLLKPGMSGQAKIQGRTMPVILAFTRPIIRFVQVQIWSWIP